MMRNLIYIFLLLMSNSLLAQSQEKIARLDSLFELLESNNKAMLSIDLMKNGQPVYNRQIGFADAKNKLNPNAETGYRIGSISKMFTSVLIFQEIEKGTLNLSTPLSNYFPQIKGAEKITIDQLLNHHSGLHNFTEDPGYDKMETKKQSRDEMIQVIVDGGLDFEPGEKAAYSNSNYVLLGYILEKITGESYESLLQNRICTPLNLKRTKYGAAIKGKENEAFSYHYAGKWEKHTETDMSIPHGAGAIVSTPQELNHFIEGLFAGKLISAESLEKMTTLEDRYGRGIFTIPIQDKMAYGHSGGIDAFASQLAYFPDDSLAMAICINGSNYDMSQVMVGVLSIYFGYPYELPDFSAKERNLSKKEMEAYTGTYASASLPIKINVHIQDDMLMAQATGQGAFPLSPFEGDVFRFDPAGVEIAFEALEKGEKQFKTFTLHQGGGHFVFTRE
ncbi:MAG: serine hydrolase domain-containing protein [Saprospiraceae bacterium]